HNKKIAEIFTARGCPNSCDFCAVKTVHGRNYRTYSLEYIKNLLQSLKQQGYKEIVIEDDNFMVNKARARKIMALLKEENLIWTEIGGIGIKQLINNDGVDKEIITEMADSGCYRIYLAVESPDKKTLETVSKQNLFCSPDLSEKVIHYLNSVGIEVYGGFMIGFPQETINNVKNTVNYAAHLKTKGMKYAILFHTTPVPGTVLWQKLKNAIVGCQLDYCFERSNYDSPHISAKILNKKRKQLLIKANGHELANCWESGGTWPT
ncbi:B12-binding domain-containing radical SAM protein, partial [Patescibacteria group bacterium]